MDPAYSLSLKNDNDSGNSKHQDSFKEPSSSQTIETLKKPENLKPETIEISKNLLPELQFLSPLRMSNTFSRITDSKDLNRRSSPQLEYIQDLIAQVPKDDQLNSTEGSHRPLSMASLNQFESETMLTSMIDDIEERLPSLNRPKDKQLRLTLQTLKSALVAERSQLQASRLDPILLHEIDDEDDIEADAEDRTGSPVSKDSNYSFNLSKELTTLEISLEPSSICDNQSQSSTARSDSKAGSELEKGSNPLSRTTSLETRLAFKFDGFATEPQRDLLSQNFSPHLPLASVVSERTLTSLQDSSIRSEAFQATIRTRLSAKKFVAYAWCSWCFRRTIHGRAQRNLLRRSRYKCTECAQTTLKCRTHCGNMARGHSDYDEELCARCDGTLSNWGEERPHRSGYCSACFHKSTHRLIHRGYVLHDTYLCDFCKTPTFLCATCQSNFGVFESNMVLISELLHYTCAACGDQIADWEDPCLLLRRQIGSGESQSSSTFYRKPLVRFHHPYESFAEVRSNIACEALVDGEVFYERSFQWIDQARDTIFMSCWWLAPFVHLQRQNKKLDNVSRLCDLLWKKALEGVRVYVLLWHNSMFITLCSEEAKTLLEGDHANIHVMRHPSYTLPNFMWSHHQKFLVVDYSKAIAGGLDFAVGRYDNHKHQLTDLGIPYNLRPPSPPLRTPLFDSETPHGNSTEEDNNSDVHFQDAKPLADSEVIAQLRGMNEVQAYLKLKREGKVYEPTYLWPGLDYYQPQDARPENYNTPLDDIIDRRYRCRMPWHDVSVAIEGLAAYDVGANFVERWNHHRKNLPFEASPKIGLPKPPASLANPRGRSTCEVQIVRSLSDWSGLQGRTTEASVYGAYMAAISRAQHYIYIENQYVVSSIAGGGVENRIVAAILERIRFAINHDRIFRVFIMFPIPEETGRPANHMLQLSYQTLFRGGYSLLDQLKLEFPNVDPFQYVGFYFLRTHGALLQPELPPNSPMNPFSSPDSQDTNSKDGTDWTCVTDMVFVHSKILLVDDEVAIIASNNLNDRSMMGNRDSELGAVILDTVRVPMYMNGQVFEGRRFTRDLRVQLWREHLGLVGSHLDDHAWVKQLTSDPIHNNTYYDIWRHVAQSNTSIYKTVFPNIPSNSFSTFSEYLQFNEDVKSGRRQSPIFSQIPLLAKTQGNLCFHPTRFCHLDSLDWAIIEDMLGNEIVS